MKISGDKLEYASLQSDAVRLTFAYFCLLYGRIIGISILAFSTRFRLSHAMHALTSVLAGCMLRSTDSGILSGTETVACLNFTCSHPWHRSLQGRGRCKGFRGLALQIKSVDLIKSKRQYLNKSSLTEGNPNLGFLQETLNGYAPGCYRLFP